MSVSRHSCLFVLSSAVEGVSVQCFMQAFTLAQTAFNVQLVSPSGAAVEYIGHDDNSRRWMSEFRSKSYAKPITFEAVEASHYAALFLPNSVGAVKDLSNNVQLGNIIAHFCHEKKPICAIGLGVAGLFTAMNTDGSWKFKGFNMTATSVLEIARTPYFAGLSVMPEDFIKDHCAHYCSSDSNGVHCIIDQYLITAQNDQSTLIAIQTLILLASQRK